jgi:hypothetical protein
MRKLILTLGFTFFVTCLFACAPPLDVQKAFKQKFPQATKICWAMENTGEWTAAFSLQTTRVAAKFALDGTWLETENLKETAELPTSCTKPKKTKPTRWIIIEPNGSVTA